jgi:hypothetical protein
MSETRLAPGARLAVRFLRRWQIYFRSDVATFPARMSAGLVSRGIAERVNIVPPDGAPPPAGTIAFLATRPPGEPPARRGSGPDEDDFVL